MKLPTVACTYYSMHCTVIELANRPEAVWQTELEPPQPLETQLHSEHPRDSRSPQSHNLSVQCKKIKGDPSWLSLLIDWGSGSIHDMR